MTDVTARNADLLLAVQRGDMKSMHELATRMRLGVGGPMQSEAAVVLLQLAARRGHAEAQLDLGLMYTAGEGMPADDQAAAYWIRRAAQHGLPKALYRLACLFFYGQGVTRDLAQAYRLCLQARQAGFADSGDILAAAAHYVGAERCAEIAAELGTEPPPIWDAGVA